jgi:hypothetical protein
MSKPIERALGLRPIEDALSEVVEHEDITYDEEIIDVEQLPAVTEEKSDLEALAAADDTLKDIEKARANVERIIGLGDDSLDELINLAKQSESPRAFEVVSGMMKTLLDANRDFVDLSMRKKYAKEEIINPKKEEEAQTNVTNNNLILSTADLLKMIKGEKE